MRAKNMAKNSGHWNYCCFTRALIVILLFVFTASLQSQDQDEGVVLLHGLCRTKSSMKKMEKALLLEGYRVVNIAYLSRSGSINKLSDETIAQALENPELKDCTKIHFVTHSLGGILVRSYFKRHNFSRIGRVVMLGPPNQGSEVVDILGSWWLFRKVNGPAGVELTTASDSLPNNLGPVNFECGVIAGTRSINWINSMMIKGKDDGKVSVERTKVEGMKAHLKVPVTHPYLMKNKRVIKKTIKFLESGSFS